MAFDAEYGAARQDVLAKASEEARTMAAEGLAAREIVRLLEHGLTRTERELLSSIAAGAVADARRPAPASPGSSRGGSPSPVLPVVVTAVIVGVVLGLVLANRGSDQGQLPLRHGTAGRHRPTNAPHKRPAPAKVATTPGPAATPPSPPASPAGTEAPAALNDRGFALMQAGRYQEAIPPLRQAVSASASDGADLSHAYALYNLARSLRLAGRPQEAIPLLEQRLKIDNQRATVARELDAARRSAHDTGGAR
jgi:eukaryotic-like serine/threonine-protein kinase